MQSPPRILIVDDDHSLRVLLIEYLSGHGMKTGSAATAAEAVEALASETYDLVLLDLGLPDGDGLELARRWRAEGEMPIICLTGRTEEADRVMGLELGADDYVTKPFSPREVLARVRSVLRRMALTHKPDTGPLRQDKLPRAYRFGGWTLNLNTRRLTSSDDRKVPLTNSEFNVLVVLLAAHQRVVSREHMIERTRAFDDVYDRAIDVQILRLRRKIEDDARAPRLLCTERGAGYFLNADIEEVW
ncbi:response regulator transcription factor [Chitinasiproducens palmae]|uniref:DNA-binding response regulator, OmpR family, contains REC and winged-helix (WHTH) domain n=1 Tax=Chitinasiproducens palmae TaxID=1770053 RepID=A0A1H2PKY3_9BURK|nr:response regulator transcription factor [Chitinasiproducens palmae]SDV47127.1 DNA-binding response regulator, OmpR family, contains REC and winged-helix (wHTH) domain [Chitinasiproducens palmae]